VRTKNSYLLRSKKLPASGGLRLLTRGSALFPVGGTTPQTPSSSPILAIFPKPRVSA